MPDIYIDTSALVKRYWHENGSDFVQELFQYQNESGKKLYTLRQTIGEVGSAAARLMREGKFTGKEASSYVQDFLNESRSIMVFIDPVPKITYRSLDFIFKYPLKAADALHLACTEDARRNLSSEKFCFVSDDSKLCDAADGENFDVLRSTDAEAVKYLKRFRMPEKDF